MNKGIQAASHSLFWPLVLLTVLICSACASTGATQTPTSHATPAAKQPPLSQPNILSGPITYVALGASDAVGAGSDQPGSQGYVPLIAAHLPQGSHLVNLGISGIRVHEALTEELPIALSTSPGLVTIWLVANDFVDGVSYTDYTHDLDALLSQLRTRTRAKLVMANLRDLTRLPAFASLTLTQKAQMLQQIQRWNAGI